MRKLIFIILFCFSVLTINAQIYLDEFWHQVKTKAEATYYRRVEPVENKFLVTDYYVSTDAKQMKAICSSLDPTPVLDGEAAFYYEDGTLQKEGNYTDNKPIGFFKEYYQNGSKKSEMNYQGDDERYINYWDEVGNPLLQNGTGLISQKVKDPNKIEYKAISNFTLVDWYLTRAAQKDTIYNNFDIEPKYVGGLDAMYRQINRNVIYPRSARRAGTEGKVFISFLIDKDGKATEVKIIKGISYDCDQAALAAFAKLGNWQPAKKRGKPVKSNFILPINFKLSR